MSGEVRLSERSRKMLERQREILSEQNEHSATAETAMAILKLVEVLERDNQLREREARLEEYFEIERRWSEQRMAEQQREIEQEEIRRKRVKNVLCGIGIALLFTLFLSAVGWMLS